MAPETGKWSLRRRAGEPDDSPVGFGSLEPVWGVWPRFHAVYAHGARLFFQAGSRRWDVTEGVGPCTFWQLGYGAMSGLALTFLTGERYRSVLIHPWRALWTRIDPTYDGIDAEQAHFFLYLRQQLPDARWRRELIARETGFDD